MGVPAARPHRTQAMRMAILLLGGVLADTFGIRAVFYVGGVATEFLRPTAGCSAPPVGVRARVPPRSNVDAYGAPRSSGRPPRPLCRPPPAVRVRRSAEIALQLIPRWVERLDEPTAVSGRGSGCDRPWNQKPVVRGVTGVLIWLDPAPPGASNEATVMDLAGIAEAVIGVVIRTAPPG